MLSLLLHDVVVGRKPESLRVEAKETELPRVIVIGFKISITHRILHYCNLTKSKAFSRDHYFKKDCLDAEAKQKHKYYILKI